MPRCIGFVGLGTMGLPMVENLAKDPDLEVLGFDSADTPFEALEKHPAWGQRLFRAKDMEALAACEVVILMLPNSVITNAVVLGETEQPGLLGILRPGTTVIDMGSSDPVETKRLVSLLAEAGIALVDAPVSGALAKARSGTLSIMVGTDAEGLERLRPILSRLGERLIPTGKPSSAHAMKALNNYVYAAGLLAVSEATEIAERFGLDLDSLAEVLLASSGRNSAVETKLKQFILPGTYAGGFLLRLQAKDLRTAARLGEITGVSAKQLALCSALWDEAAETMPADSDNTAIHRFVKAGEAT